VVHTGILAIPWVLPRMREQCADAVEARALVHRARVLDCARGDASLGAAALRFDRQACGIFLGKACARLEGEFFLGSGTFVGIGS
jgi:hypothetical protein